MHPKIPTTLLLGLTPNELLNWIAKEVTRFAKRKTRAIFVNQLTWC